MKINDALTKHLPTKLAEAFKSARPDPADFLAGVNFQYENKTWNIRVFLNEEKGLFVRTHSLTDIFADYYLGANPKKDSAEAEGVYKKKYKHFEPNSSGDGTWPLHKKSAHFPFKPYHILTKGTFISVAGTETPKSISRAVNYAKDFFESCPELIPEVAPDLPPVTSKPKSTEESSSFPYGMIFKAIMSLAALFLLYKVVGFTSSFWQESKT